MKRRYFIAASLCCLFVVACGRTEEESSKTAAPVQGVTISDDERVRLGIETLAVQSAEFTPELRGLGLVLVVADIAQADADLTTAEAALHASEAAFQRARGLFKADKSISQESLEQTERQAAADAALFSLAKRRAEATFGRDIAGRDPVDRHALMKQLGNGDAVLVRATFPTSALTGAVPLHIRVERLGEGQAGASWTAQALWPAPADPTIPGASFFGLIEEASGLAEGEHVAAYAAISAAKKGVIVPASAVVLSQGVAWCYVARPDNVFQRRKIVLTASTGDGYFVNEDITVGQAIVVKGAGLLLARETGAAEGGS